MLRHLRYVGRSLGSGARIASTVLVLGFGLAPTSGWSQQVPTRTAQPTRAIGQLGSQVEFSRVGGLTVMGDTLVVLEPTRVVLVDRDGDLIGQIGREGVGPGEFRHAIASGVRGDGLWVADGISRRTTVFSFDGGVVSTRTLNRVSVGREGFVMQWALPQSDSTYVAVTGYRPTAVRAGLVAAQPLLVVNDAIEIVDTLASLELAPHDVAVLQEGPGGVAGPTFSQPIRDDPLWAVSTRAGLLAIVTRRVQDGNGRYRLLLQSLVEGDTLSQGWHRVPPVPVPGRYLAEWQDRFHETIGAMFPRAEVTRELYQPEFFPAAGWLTICTSGQVWVSRQYYVGDETEWDVFDPEGRKTFQIRLPRGRIVLDADEGGVWVRNRGEYGEEYLEYWEYR